MRNSGVVGASRSRRARRRPAATATAPTARLQSVRRYFRRPAAQQREAPADYSHAPTPQRKRKRRGRVDRAGPGRQHGRLARLRPGRCLRREARDLSRAQASHLFGLGPLRHTPRRRMGAGGEGDHRGRQAEIHRDDDRHQRPPVDPRTPSRSGARGRRQRAGKPADDLAAPAQTIRNCRHGRAPTSRTPSSRNSRQRRRRKLRSSPHRSVRPLPAMPARSSSTPKSGKRPMSGASTRRSRQ